MERKPVHDFLLRIIYTATGGSGRDKPRPYGGTVDHCEAIGACHVAIHSLKYATWRSTVGAGFIPARTATAVCVMIHRGIQIRWNHPPDFVNASP